MATTITSGAASTADPLSNRLKVDMHEPIRMLDPDVSQFSTMLSDPRIGSEKLESYLKEWLEDRLIPRVMTLSASATSAQGTLATGTGEAAYAKVGDIIRVPSTGEAVRVTGTDSSTSLSVVRGLGSVTAASAASASNALIIVGGSNGQGGSLPTRLITQQTRNYNYGQITRNSWGFTRTAMQSSWWSMNVLESEREKKASEHKTDLENTKFFGARAYSANSPSGEPQGQAGGFIEYITTNKTNVNGAWTKSAVQDFFTTGLQYGSQDKVLFVAPKPSQILSAFLADNWIRADVGTTLYGAKVNAFITGAFGTEVPVIVKRQWGAYGTGTSGQYGSYAVLVDLKSVKNAVMQPSVRYSDRQARDLDGLDEEYLNEETLIVMQEQHHAIAYNITS